MRTPRKEPMGGEKMRAEKKAFSLHNYVTS